MAKQQQPTNSPPPIPVTASDITLDNGMLAGLGISYGSNNDWTGPQDAWGGYPNNKLNNGSGPFVPLRVGVLQNTAGSLPGLNNATTQVWGCYFQYNPNEIALHWEMSPDQQIPYIYTQGKFSKDNAVTKGIPSLLAAQEIRWTLLFDRTYDVLYTPNPHLNRGVLKDIAALYNVLGAFETVGATPMSTPCQVMFGATADGQVWGFTGNITGLDITFGVFRGDTMIPFRCTVALTMSVRYIPLQTPPTSRATSGAATKSGHTNQGQGAAQGKKFRPVF